MMRGNSPITALIRLIRLIRLQCVYSTVEDYGEVVLPERF